MSRPVEPGSPSAASEDSVVIAGVLRRLADAVGLIGQRADGNVNHGDLYDAINEAYQQAHKEALRDV